MSEDNTADQEFAAGQEFAELIFNSAKTPQKAAYMLLKTRERFEAAVDAGELCATSVAAVQGVWRILATGHDETHGKHNVAKLLKRLSGKIAYQ